MSSTVCWAAFLSYMILNKRPRPTEVYSLLVIMLGLVLSAMAQKQMGVVKTAEDVHGIDPLAGKVRAGLGGESEARSRRGRRRDAPHLLMKTNPRRAFLVAARNAEPCPRARHRWL